MKQILSGWLLFVLLQVGISTSVSAATASQGMAEEMSREMVGRVTRMLKNKAAILADNISGRTDWKVQVKEPGNLRRLEPCIQGFQLEDTRSGEAGRQRVKVRCEGPRNWSIYLSGDIQVYANVLVAVEPLMSKSSVSSGSVSLKKWDIGELRRGYITSKSFLNGRILKRRVKTGAPLNPGMFEKAYAVYRKESVLIRASGKSGLAVSMPGTAMENAVVGERVRVRNLSSGKEIVARVQGAGIVTVDF